MNVRPLLLLAALWPALLSVPVAGAQSEGLTLLFQQGNQAYDLKNYEQALASYNQLLRLGVMDGRLYYNTGNAYYRQGDIGRAVLFYLRAQRLLPNDPDVQANLALARASTRDKLPLAEPGLALQLLGWPYYHLSRDALLTWVLAMYLLTAALIVLRITSRYDLLRRRSGQAAVVMAALLAFAAANYGMRLRADALRAEAVVLDLEATGRSGPGDTFTEIFKLHAGAEVTVHNSREGWIQVSLANGLAGWVPAAAAERILPDG